MTIEFQPEVNQVTVARGAVSVKIVSRNNSVNVVRNNYDVSVEKGEHAFTFHSRDQEESTLEVQGEPNQITVERGQNLVEVERAVNDATFVKNVLEPTFEKGINRVTIQLGQCIRGSTEAYTNVEFYAVCSTAEAVGDPVYIFAPPVLGVYNVRKVSITDTVKMPAIGVVKEKLTDTSCRILVCGILEGAYSGLTPGYMLYAAQYGGLVHSAGLPDPLVTRHYAQIIGQAASDTDAVIQINPTPCWRIG
jgi:hypothetical protein